MFLEEERVSEGGREGGGKEKEEGEELKGGKVEVRFIFNFLSWFEWG